MKTADFLTAIYGDATGIATLVVRSASSGDLTEQKFYEYPEQKHEMAAFAAAHAMEDVYFSPILFNAPRRIKENAKTVHVIYADADSCQPEDFLVEPSISVQTSDKRWHTYWMLDQEVEPLEAALLAKKIAYAHSHQGCDKSGWNTTKLLRLPNTRNLKREDAWSIEATTTGQVYSFEEINAVYGDVEVEPIREMADLPMPAGFPPILEVLEKLSHNPQIVGLYMEQPAFNADLSRLLWKLEMELFREGLTAEEVFTVARHAKCNKYHSPDRPKRLDADGDLWREVQRAEQSYAAEQGEASYVPEPITEDAPVARFDKVAVSFLTEEEREVVQLEPTFIDNYVKWARSKTDGALSYQIASAFTVLSAVFSDWGYAVPRYGKMGLNLWFMVLGETTLTRKSTSRNLMLRVIRAYEKFGGYQIDIGSDATPEGVTAILAERDKKTSLLHRDEVQGMFKDFMNKTYMASAAERYTELYDGSVPVVIRSSKDKRQTERAETNFIMYLMGITSKVADVLTTEYFRSGFLARFIYVTADAPERSRELEDIQQADEYEVVVKDTILDDMVRKLFDAVTYWQKKGQPNPRPLRLSQASLERFNQYKWEMGNYAESHREKESIEPSRQRLALSVWKCAILLAMADKSDEVKLKHMLTAISYSEDWFENLVRMASAISASEWQRDVDQLEAYVVDRGGRVRYEEAYRKFNNKRKREFDDMVEALRSQARVISVVDNRKTYLEVVR
jgi:DnaJ-domain-containing protein 1